MNDDPLQENDAQTSTPAQEAEAPPQNGWLTCALTPEHYPSVDHLITQDDAHVDNTWTDKQRRLLPDAVSSSWKGPEDGKTFMVMADVAIFPKPEQTPIVPDVLLAIDVEIPADIRANEHRSYFVWVVGKPPTVVFEIVSDKRGDEDSLKLRRYAGLGIPYYVIFDPDNHLQGGVLRVFELRGTHYELVADNWLTDVGLGLRLWQGVYEGTESEWLRWCDRDGNVIPTGRERAEEERHALMPWTNASNAWKRNSALSAQIRLSKELSLVSGTIQCAGKCTREINRELRAAIAAGQTDLRVVEPDARHNLAVALLQPVRVVLEGSVGYYCGGMMDGARVEVRGSAGWGAAESMLGGTVVIDGNAGSGVAASIRGGTVIVRGDAAARAGVSMKGGTLLIGGSAGYMAGFMMQKGRIVICGDAGDALADSMYEGVVFVGGTIASLGNDTAVQEPTDADAAALQELLASYGVPAPASFKKIVSGRKLWNFDRRELEIWKAAL